MEARKPDEPGSNTPIGLASAGASLASPIADFASPAASSSTTGVASSGASSSAASSSSSGTRRSLCDSDAAGEVDEAPTKRAKCAASADQHHRAASLGSLATVELQLVMQCLDRTSLIKLANCSKTLQRAADHPFAWVYVPTVRVGVATDADVARLASGVSRHAPLNIVHAAAPGAVGFERFDLAPLVTHRVTKLTYNHELADSQIDAIRQMRWLVQFSTSPHWNDFNRSEFDRLLAPGHQLDKLEQLDLRRISIDADAIRLLVGLPSLNRLDPFSFNLSVWTSLTLLPNLTHVAIRSEFKHTAADVQAFYTALASLQQLRSCRIVVQRTLMQRMHPKPVVAIPPLPRLRHLTLSGHQIESFAFLRNLPQIKILYLCECDAYCRADVFATLMANWAPRLRHFLIIGADPLTSQQHRMIAARIDSVPRDDGDDAWKGIMEQDAMLVG